MYDFNNVVIDFPIQMIALLIVITEIYYIFSIKYFTKTKDDSWFAFTIGCKLTSFMLSIATLIVLMFIAMMFSVFVCALLAILGIVGYFAINYYFGKWLKTKKRRNK